MQKVTQVLDALVIQGVVEILPRELGLDESSRVEALHRFDHLKIWHVQFWVLGRIIVFLGHQYAIYRLVGSGIKNL